MFAKQPLYRGGTHTMDELREEIINMIKQIDDIAILRRIYLILVVISGTDH